MDAPVVYQEHEAANGKKVIQATLNSSQTLNALSQPMIESLLPKLTEFQDDPSVVCIVLDGAGDKAFCAGGDIKELYQAMAANPGEKQSYVETFFTHEYQLDHLIHSYKKPIVLWGNGFVMGGGLGLMAGASHRVVTESSKVAMPELSIGLYPDVGGTYFLNQMPGNIGLFLGLTAAQMNASDALEVKLADHFLLHEQKAPLLSLLSQLFWKDDANDNHALVSGVLSSMAEPVAKQLPVGNIAAHRDTVDALLASDCLSEMVSAVLALETDDKWLSRAQSTLKRGSAISAHLVNRQLQVGKDLSLEACFRLELGLSVRCGQLGEFTEGVRALLIEKDNQPKWLYASVDEVPAEVIDGLFEPLWDEAEHPLAALSH